MRRKRNRMALDTLWPPKGKQPVDGKRLPY
jgi:hypothetical protein